MPVFSTSRPWASSQSLLQWRNNSGSAQKRIPSPRIRKEKVKGSRAGKTGGQEEREPLSLGAGSAAVATSSKKRTVSVGLWLEEDVLLVGEQPHRALSEEKASLPVSTRIRSLSTGVVSREPLKESSSLGAYQVTSSGGVLFDASLVTETLTEAGEGEMGCIECRHVDRKKRSKRQRKRTTASVSLQLGDLSDFCRARSHSRTGSSASEREETAIQCDDSAHASLPREGAQLATPNTGIGVISHKSATVRKISKATVSYGALPIDRTVSRSTTQVVSSQTKRRANSLNSSGNLRVTIKAPSFTHSVKKTTKRCQHSRKASTAISPRKRMTAACVLETFLDRRPSQDDLIQKNILPDEETYSGMNRAKNMISHLLRKKRKKDLTTLGYQSSDEDLLATEKADKSQQRAEKLLDAVHQRGLLVDEGELEIMSKIGEGAYSNVFLANLKGSLVAVKRLKTTKHTMKAFYRELDCLLRFGKHDNVVSLIGVTVEPHKSLVLEYAPCGSIYTLLHEKGVKPSLSQALQLAVDIAAGMKEVHSSHVLHRDLTTRNILYSNGRAVIADFGIARHASCKKALPHCYSPIGHQRYRAPEVSNKEPYNCKADVYTFGTVLYELITGEEAWVDIGDKQVAALQREGNTPLIGVQHECPLALQKLVYKCWAFKPKARPSFKELSKALQELSATEEKQRVNSK